MSWAKPRGLAPEAGPRAAGLQNGAGAEPVGHVRIGYARASSAGQLLDTQTDALAAAGVSRVLAEKISTRATARPELDAAVSLARDIRGSGWR